MSALRRVRSTGLACLALPLLIAHAAAAEIVGEPSGGLLTQERAEAPLAANDHILIGEIHDNPDHHANQAALIETLADMGRKPAIVFEMVPERLQPALDAFISGETGLDRLGEALEWEERGWPSFEFYRPIFDVAARHELPMLAGGLDRPVVTDIVRGTMSTADRERFGLDRPIAPDGEAALRRVIVESHCGMIDEAAAGPMVDAQRAKDVRMAERMLDAKRSGASSVVLIAGNGHVRRDFGVPQYLPGSSVLVIGQIEETPLTDASERADDRRPFDEIIRGEPRERSDPCEAFRGGAAERRQPAK